MSPPKERFCSHGDFVKIYKEPGRDVSALDLVWDEFRDFRRFGPFGFTSDASSPVALPPLLGEEMPGSAHTPFSREINQYAVFDSHAVTSPCFS